MGWSSLIYKLRGKPAREVVAASGPSGGTRPAPSGLPASCRDEVQLGLLEALQAPGLILDQVQQQWRDAWLAAPESAEGLLDAGRLSEVLGRPNWARHFLQQCLALASDLVAANGKLGILLYAEQDWLGAIACLAKAISRPIPNEVCVANLGAALYKAGEEDDALALLQRAYEQDPDSDALARNLFQIALRSGSNDLARRVAEHACANPPRPPADAAVAEAGGLINLAGTLDEVWPRVAAAQLAIQEGNYAEAGENYRALCVSHPVNGQTGLGIIAMAEGRFSAAHEHFSRAIGAAAERQAHLYLNRAKAAVALARHHEASADLDRALEIQGDYHGARVERGIVHLRLGDWQQGWRDYEVRRIYAPESQFAFFDPGAEWQGQPLSGKTLVLVGEQGQGDVIQFVCLAADLAAQGAEVIVYCPPSLRRLVLTVPGVAGAFTEGETIPAYDYWVPLMSVPGVLGLRLESLRWNGPYVRPAPDDVTRWDKQLGKGNGLHVGLVWAGKDFRGHTYGQIYGRRNLVFDDLLPLFTLEGIRWFSLQKGEAAAQMASCAASYRIEDYAADWRDFYDTAAFVANLDLVVTVDTSVAHLAGALGIPVWIMSRTDGCWRWLDRRSDSPWYPSARIFHQGVGESWSAVIGRVAAALALMLRLA